MRTEWVESTAVAPLSTTLIYLFIEMIFLKCSFTNSITPGTFQIFLLKISSLLGTCSSTVHHGLIFVFLTNTERERERGRKVQNEILGTEISAVGLQGTCVSLT